MNWTPDLVNEHVTILLNEAYDRVPDLKLNYDLELVISEDLHEMWADLLLDAINLYKDSEGEPAKDEFDISFSIQITEEPDTVELILTEKRIGNSIFGTE